MREVKQTIKIGLYYRGAEINIVVKEKCAWQSIETKTTRVVSVRKMDTSFKITVK